MSQNSALPPPSSRPPVGTSPASRPSQVSPPSLVRDNTMAERFARKLVNRDKASAEEQSRPDSAAGEKKFGKAAKESGREAQDGFGEGGGDGAAGLTGLLRLSAAAHPVPTRGVASLGIDLTMIDRIAAQIAEVQPAIANQSAVVTFPAGTIVGSAMVTREADGGLSIRLTGLDPRVGALRADRLRTSLLSSLERRRIRTSEVTFEDKGATTLGDQDDRDSITSRVV